MRSPVVRPGLLVGLALLALASLLPGALTAQRCRCRTRARAVPRCAEGSVARPFADVYEHAAELDGQTVVVRGVLHTVFGCADRIGADGCEAMCGGQVVLLERAGSEDAILYLGEASTEGRFGCSGESSDCPCCALDAHDQPVEVTGVLRATPTLRLEAPSLCRLP